MEKIRDNWGKNYKTQKSLEQEKINATSAKYNQDIQAKEQQLQSIATSLNMKTNESLKSEGFQGLYNVLAKYINDIKIESYEIKQTTSEDVSFWLNFCISISLEFFGIGFIYLSMKEESVSKLSTQHSNGNHNIGFKHLATTTANESNTIQNFKNFNPSDNNNFPNTIDRRIGFVYENPKTLIDTDFYNGSNDIKIEDLKKYIEYMYNSDKYKNFQESPGYNPIGRDTQIGIETARKIKAYLERLGIVETIGTKTFVRVDLQACKEKVQA
jgi:hypothetical protein